MSRLDRSLLLLNPQLVEANRMPREEPPRPLDIGVDLMVEFQRRAELLLAAQKLMKVEPHDVAVNIRVEIEDVALDGQRVILVERRADSDVRDALERSREALETRRRDVNPTAGEKLVGRIDVDRRESDLAAETASGDHAAVDEVRTA